MDDPFAGIDVFRQLDLAHRVRADRADRRHHSLERVQRRRQQLTGDARIAEVVGPFAKEPDTGSANVKTRPHPVAVLRRSRHGRRRRQLDASDPPERVGDHLALERQLPRIRDVAVEAAAAERIGGSRAAVRRWLGDRHHGGVSHAFGHARQPRLHALARDRPGHQQHAALVTGDHRPADGRFLDRHRQDVARLQHRLTRRRSSAA